MNDSFDINILCNGSRCKQYKDKKGRTYIESKEGSEYAIELKNNSWEKILAVISVDGLNILDGEAADENGGGYVLDKYTAQKFYGYQYSDDKVAAFKFGALGAVKIDPATGKPEIDPDTGKEIKLGYASSKETGAEKNAGVIGVRIWDEIPQPPPPPPPPPPVGGLYGPGRYSYAISGSYSSNPMNLASYSGTGSAHSNITASWSCQSISGAFGTTVTSATTTVTPNYQSLFGGCCANANVPVVRDMAYYSKPENMVADKASFDIETTWGGSKTYRVKETTFERRGVIHRFDIYYASRKALIEMGVDLGMEKRVNFPESFKSDNKYAKPPKGWKEV